MRQKVIKMLPAVLMAAIVAGCAYDRGKEHDESESALIKTTNPPPIELKEREEEDSVAYQVRKEVSEVDGIYDAAVLEGDKEIIVAYKVNHLQRFRMKKIEKKLKAQLEKAHPEDKFIVSSDYKIFLEAIRLKEDLDDDHMSNKEAKKRFKKIVRLEEEMT